MDDRLLEVRNLKMYFPVTSGLLVPRKVGEVKAVDGVSFSINHGETLGLVGESGSGKSTLGLCLLQLYKPTGGEVIYGGRDLCLMGGGELRRVRRKMQMIFQDPYGSLNPRMTVGNILSEPLQIHRLTPKAGQRGRVAELLTMVGLEADQLNRYPHEFSAGQRQRVGIARALAVDPNFIVCDEPVSALDVCVQTQILDLLLELQTKLDLTYLFIAHDLAVVGYVSNRIAVMYLGRIVELGTTDHILRNPAHPYTQRLLTAIPVPDRAVEKARKRTTIPGEAPVIREVTTGCKFEPGCTESDALCRETAPVLKEIGPEHWVACRKS